MDALHFLQAKGCISPIPVDDRYRCVWTGQKYEWVQKDQAVFFDLRCQLEKFLMSLPKQERREKMGKFVTFFNALCTKGEKK
jgi:hypothetical protein